MPNPSEKKPRSITLSSTIPINLLLYSVLIIPFIIMIYLSFVGYNPAAGYNWWEAPFLGLKNFSDALQDQRFLQALGRTMLFVGLAVGLEFLIGLLLSILMMGEFKGKRSVISILCYPLMLPWVVVGSTFYLIYQNYGPINHIFLKAIFGTAPNTAWLADSTTAFLAILTADVWQWTPFMFLILYSGLSAVPKRLVEAAEVLGASPRQIFWRIRLPLIKPLIFIAIILRSLEAFKIFDTVYIMTGGGPGTTTETISVYIYKLAIVYHDISYASAVSLIILLIIGVASWYSIKVLTK